MSETNKTYRIKTDIGSSNNVINIDTSILQDYDTLDILSLKINSVDMYKLHNSNYGVVVGRVLANNGFGVPNAKLSIFIEVDSNEGEKVRYLYPFTSTSSKDENNVRYNLLPNNKVSDCHQVVGTFPNKRYMLDNDVVLEVFDKYYKYTTRTNNSGDYLIMGVPVGSHTLHMDLDLSDCGILSQKPRDFVYKGYTIEQFESPTMFKKDTELSNLSQIFTQNQTINVLPFWGNESSGEQIGITRADINISFKFETTCVFLGSVVSDSPSNGITRKCMATENMGNMEELTTGEGTIEMIRKTPSGEIEEFQVKGTQLIDSNGVWCYQIPMNLDYMMTDEYGNMVPTDDPEKGIPTRASVRFRISMQDNEENTDNFYRAKVLIPHNPQYKNNNEHEDYDYEFGTYTKNESFRDLFMDNVYSVKSYIPRFQKKKTRGWKDKNFTGFKSCNFHGSNNPIPYNNMRIKLPFMFTVMCAIIKCFIFLTGIFNTLISSLGNFLAKLGDFKILGKRVFPGAWNTAIELKLNVLSEGLCPDLENWYFAPMQKVNLKKRKGYDLMKQTLSYLLEENGFDDEQSIEYENSESEDEVMCLTTKTDYLISCVEMNLAMEYKVINFDFYNDWINGLIYIPRFMYYVKPKKTFLGITFAKRKIRSCMDNSSIFAKTRRYTQQCAIPYKKQTNGGYITFSEAENILEKNKSNKNIKKSNNFHKKNGFTQISIFGRNGGICHEHTTSKKQNVYYMKPCEWKTNSKVLFYATDIILLGSLQGCNREGIPQAFKYLSSTSYVMPTNLALTNMETNGALYTNDKDTLCAGSSSQLEFGNEDKNDAVRLFKPQNGLAAELKVYANSGDKNIDTIYDGNELSDLIPLTEAAGIAWNYTGPDQGEINKKQIYYPGGHFLGLTCTNSQSNIKSCLNLSRICELGVNMSQRMEEVSNISFSSDGKPNITYINTIPTGFISGNDIVAEDFRAMFATLNQNRLCATKFNPETGYYVYDFDFVKPINFNGAFKKVAENSEGNYNKIGVEYNYDKDLLSFGIAPADGRPDGEGFDSLKIQALTNEDNSLDYYRFRLGLDYDNLRTNDTLQKSHFLHSSSGRYYLPQYENSFYFYFGMKQGATAIDEFNRQFFSVCDTTKIITGIPTIDLSVSDIDICTGKGSIKVTFDNFELPLTSFHYEVEKDGKIEVKHLMGVNENYKSQYTSIIEDLDFGRYTFYAIDSTGVEISKVIDLGIDIFLYNLKTYDFNVFDSSEWVDNNGIRESINENIYVGGYVNISNINVIEDYQEIFNNESCKIIVKYIDDYNNTKTIFKNTDFNGENNINIFVPKAYNNNETSIVYSIYLEYKLTNTCDISNIVSIYLTSFTVKDGKDVKLKIGFPEYNFYYTIGGHENDDDSEFVYPTVEKNIETNLSYLKPNITKGSLYFGNNGGIENKSLRTNNLQEWLQTVCTTKTSSKLVPFSNNVYTDNDLKVVWGMPQSINGTFTNSGICCTEGDIVEGYTLDDDASYFNANGNNCYSSVAIDGDNVSGDFYGKLEKGQFTLVNCKGIIPKINTGYVFKPLPEGDLEYYVCSSNGDYKSNSGMYTDGLFYSSFYYDVNTKPFGVDARFYIWGDRYVFMPENKDAEPEIKYQELAGRCEITVKNGIKYKDKLGAEGKNIEISNMTSAITSSSAFCSTYSSAITVSSMTYTGYITKTDENGDEYDEYVEYPSDVDIKYQGNTLKVAGGYEGQTQVYINLSEGYPDIENNIVKEENKQYYLSSIVSNVSDYIEYENNFCDYASYEYLEGQGVVASLRYLEEKNVSTSINNSNCLICLQSASTYQKLITIGEGNDKYIYLRIGGKRRPTYYILFSYVSPGNDDDDKPVHDNRPGELCFIKVDYYKNRRYRLYFSYNQYDDSNEDDEGDDNGGEKITISWRKKRAGGDRNNIDKFLEFGNGKGLDKYMEPVLNRKIISNTFNTTWENLILEHNQLYKKNIKNKIKQPKDGIYYCVEKKEHSIENSNVILYKIHPTFLLEIDEDDGITLSSYSLDWSLYKDNNNKYLVDGDIIKYTKIIYNISQTDSNDGPYNATTMSEALAKLNISMDSGFDGSINDIIKNNGLLINNDWCEISIDTNVQEITNLDEYNNFTGNTSISCTSDETFYITYSLKVKIKNGKDGKGFDENDGHNEKITFYLGEKEDGEILHINLHPFESYVLFFDENYDRIKTGEIVFENTGGTRVINVGISIDILNDEKQDISGFKISGKQSPQLSYSINNTFFKEIQNVRYYLQRVDFIVEEGDRNGYENILTFTANVSNPTNNYKDSLNIIVNKGENGIWTESNMVYYYYQDGEYDDNLIKKWLNNVVDIEKNKNTFTFIKYSNDIKDEINGKQLIVRPVKLENLVLPLVNDKQINEESIIDVNKDCKVSFILSGNTKEWYDNYILKIFENELIRYDDYTYEYEYEIIGDNKTYNNIVKCQLRPYNAFYFNIRYSNCDTSILYYHNDNTEKEVSSSTYIIPKYSDYIRNDKIVSNIQFSIKFKEQPRQGLYYISHDINGLYGDNTGDKIIFDNFGIRNKDVNNDFGEDEIEYLQLKSKDFLIDNNNKTNTLYLKKITCGCDYDIFLQLDKNSFENFDAYKDIEMLIKVTDETLVTFHTGRLEAIINLKDEKLRNGRNVYIEFNNSIPHNNYTIQFIYEKVDGGIIILEEVDGSGNDTNVFDLANLCVSEGRNGRIIIRLKNS